MKSATYTSRPVRQDERGMALAIALFAIVVIGALVAGTTYAGRIEMGGGQSALAATRALEQAETGMATAFANWQQPWNSLPIDPSPGSEVTVGSVTTGPNQRTTSVRRISDKLFLVQSTGTRVTVGGVVQASRSLGQLARLDVPTVSVDAALEGMGEVRVGGSSTVSGIDTNPTGWGACSGTLTNVPGVRASDDIRTNGGAQIFGTPPYVEFDSTVTAQGFTDVFNALLPTVTRTLGGGTYNGMAPDTTDTQPGVCDRSLSDNWGEPGDPIAAPIIDQCRGFMPVTLFTSDVQINTGKGQGILLIQGDLNIQGTFIFDGIILATGNIDFHGTGGTSSRIYGALFSANSSNVGDLISVTGAPVITYSSCAVAAALAAAGRGVPLRQRGWAQVY
jgi:hypothetical protein